jgi:hypothetical protein
MPENGTYTAFAGNRLIVSGDLKTMLLRTKACLDAGEADAVLIFEDQTGKQIDFDFRGTPEEVIARLASHALFAASEAETQSRKGPGRPRLGVIGGEVSLLPRHWDWLAQQQGGSSATLRRLVDEERKRNGGKERARLAWEAAGKFMWGIAGNLPGFEEASRALYAHDCARLDSLIQEWPADVRNHLQHMAGEAIRLEHETAVKKDNDAL